MTSKTRGRGQPATSFPPQRKAVLLRRTPLIAPKAEGAARDLLTAAVTTVAGCRDEDCGRLARPGSPAFGRVVRLLHARRAEA